MATAAYTPPTGGESHLMMGSIVCTTVLSGKETDGRLGAVEVHCPQGSGPGPHIDPWRESFYIIEGEIEFMLERDGVLQPVTAGPGAAVSIPVGLGHAFRAVSQEPARVLIMSAPAGLEDFFAAAGMPFTSRTPPAVPGPFDRPRFEAATDRYGIKAFQKAVAIA